MRINALKCLLCGDTIYSRARHDCRHCSCGKCFVDGGFDYMRYGGKEIDKAKDVKITVKATKKELFDDWNLSKDKYGLIKGKCPSLVGKPTVIRIGEGESIKRAIKSGKPEPVYKGKLPKIEVCLKKMDTIEKGASITNTKERKCTCSMCKSVKKGVQDIKEKSLFARFLDAIFANAKKYPEKLHNSKEVWDKEWGKLLKGDNKMEKSIKKGIQDIKENRFTPAETVFKKWEEEREWEKEHPILTKFKRIWWWIRYGIKNKIEDIPLNIKTFIQRSKRGWANSDTWQFDYYLTKVISEGVHNLKEHIHGMPNNLTEGQWIDILNEITYTFELAKRMSEDELYLIKDKKQREKLQKTLDEINKKHKCHDRCMTNKEIRAYERGWRLFKEYFFNLWD